MGVGSGERGGRFYVTKNPGPNISRENIQDVVNSILFFAFNANKRQHRVADEKDFQAILECFEGEAGL